MENYSHGHYALLTKNSLSVPWMLLAFLMKEFGVSMFSVLSGYLLSGSFRHAKFLSTYRSRLEI